MGKMRSVVLTAPGKVELEEMERPAPGEKDVLIRTHFCGICGTDLMDYRGQNVWGRDAYPKRPGHEISGVVAEVGAGVTHLKPGDRAVPECTIGCGECAWCKAGKYSLCRRRLKYSNGGMADYVSVPAKAVYRVPDHVSLQEAAVIEPVAVGAAAALKCGEAYGLNVGVIGGGTIGLGALMTLRLLGAARTFLFELRADRIETGLRVGATAGVNSANEDPVAAVHAQTGGAGLDAIVVASAGTAKTMGLALGLVAPQGTVVVVGLAGGQLASIDPDDLADKEATIIGSHSSPGVWDKLMASVDAGRYDLKALVSHVVPLDDAARAFGLLTDPDARANKVLLQMAEGA